MNEKIAQIRANFPRPVSALDGPLDAEGKYCVGGALWCTAFPNRDGGEAVRRFPMPSAIAEALMVLNEQLPHQEALGFANLITGTNDTRNFEAAWQYAAEVLEWRKI